MAFDLWRWFTDLFSDGAGKEAEAFKEADAHPGAALRPARAADQVNEINKPFALYTCAKCGYQQEYALLQHGGLCQSCKPKDDPDPALVKKVAGKLKFDPKSKPSLLGSIRQALNAYQWEPSTGLGPGELPIVVQRIWNRLSPSDRKRLHEELVEKGFSTPPTSEMLHRWARELKLVQRYKANGLEGPGERGNRPQFFLGGAPGSGKKR